MGRLTTNKLNQYSRGKIFIETGMESGWNIQTALEFGFTTVHTVEINPRYVEQVKMRWPERPFVHIHLGDSPDILNQICPTLTEAATFWLDAHLTGGDSGVSDKYGECPLMEELAAIGLSPYKEHAILIDDCRIMGNYGNWPTVEQVKEAIYKINPNYKIIFIGGPEDQDCTPNDVLVALVN